MSSVVYVLQKDGTLVDMNQQDHHSKDMQQDLVVKYPNPLAGNLTNEVNPREWKTH